MQGPPPSDAAAYLGAAQQALAQGDVAAARALAERAAALASAGEAAALPDALVVLALTTPDDGERSALLERAAGLLDAADRHAHAGALRAQLDPQPDAPSWGAELEAALEVGDLEVAREVVSAARRRATEAGAAAELAALAEIDAQIFGVAAAFSPLDPQEGESPQDHFERLCARVQFEIQAGEGVDARATLAALGPAGVLLGPAGAMQAALVSAQVLALLGDGLGAALRLREADGLVDQVPEAAEVLATVRGLCEAAG